MLIISAVGCFGTNWAVQIVYMLIFVAFTIVATRVASNTLIAYNAVVMPDALR